jgi:hypothetical protein
MKKFLLIAIAPWMLPLSFCSFVGTAPRMGEGQDPVESLISGLFFVLVIGLCIWCATDFRERSVNDRVLRRQIKKEESTWTE